jgi:phage gpG-like protein
MAVRGDMHALESLRRRIESVTQAGFRRDLSDVLGAAAMKVLKDQFRASVDPYGRPWLRPKLRNGQPLRNTGAMEASANFQADESGFRLSIPVRYAMTHQRGANILPKRGKYLRFKAAGRFYTLKAARIPRRQLVPERETGGLGPIWAAAFDRAAGELLRRKFDKATA